ncbi:MAG: carboxypeptidase-like regulatory domain-containing protein [Candidatus Zhuqueibacterota bacterium]
MRRSRYSGILICVALCWMMDSLFAQSLFRNEIYGVISDSETGLPLFNVNVFLASTTRGDATDAEGYYRIENIPPGSYQLIVSMIGYELVKLPVQFIANQSVRKDVQLVPKILSGDAVLVEAEGPKKWKKQLERFTEYFIGATENARSCTIVNPHVLQFEENPEGDEFLARTDSVLVIDNEALGYRVRINLEQFRLHQDSLYYTIYPFYTELTAQDEKQQHRWLKRRRTTYEGSFRHFLSSLARGKVEQEYFELQRQNEGTVTAGKLDIVHSDTSAAFKYLMYDGYLKVLYKGLSRSGQGAYVSESQSSFPTSYIKLNFGYALIDTFGNEWTKMGITRLGYWTRERIADMLPFDYYPTSPTK